MALTLYSAPAIEPVTLAEVKAHLRIDSTSFADDLTATQSIAPGSHAIAAAYTLVGSSVDVSGSSVLVLLESGTNEATGTVDVKLQDSEDATTWADVTSGAFTQITTATDNATYEKAYTGGKQYLRAVATVALAACAFGVTIIEDAPTSAEDDLLTALIVSARQWAEDLTGRALITQTWDFYRDDWPGNGVIRIPKPPLLSVTGVYYSGTTGVEATMPAADYIVDTDGFVGRVVLGYNETWPSTTLYPANPIRIRFTAGYGATAASVPRGLRQAILVRIADMYEQRQSDIVGSIVHHPTTTAEALAWPYRVLSCGDLA